jgi:LytS/YehU family sensor histidine kinase
MSDYFSGNKNYERGLFYYCKYHELATILANQNSDIRFMVERAKANALIQRRDYDILKRENQINKLQNTRYILIIITIILISALSIIGLVFLRFRSQKKNLQLKLKLKRAQINPHFIFNSLNIVQAKILEGNNFESNTYLTKFSKIVRFILENSTNNYNSLAQELEFLSSYIEMEKIRFENDLSVIIDIDNSLSTNKVWIPSLIIQPFVENAIWHGLQPKEDAPWVIKIIFEIKNKYLLIKIDDNGIGINKSIEQKQHGFKSHKKSMGLQLSKERIQTLKQIYHKNYSIEIIDKSTTSNEAGTIVTITIPINYKNERIY